MSIPHFCKLSNKRKAIFLDNPWQFSCREKLDGSNFIFGITNNQLWTARKNTKIKYWNASEWPVGIWAQNFKIAHEALQKIKIQQGLGTTGDFTACCEILSNVYPNTIHYSDKITSLIIYQGPQLPELETNITVDLISSDDGLTTGISQHCIDFQIRNLPVYQLDFVPTVNQCGKLPVNQQSDFLIDSWKHSPSDWTSERMEGLVFQHIDGWMLKIVDYNWFNEKNRAGYETRLQLFKSPSGKSNSLMDQHHGRQSEGMPADESMELALRQLSKYRDHYIHNRHSCPQVHTRNLEAFASIYGQLMRKE